jgi:hypothetical protein
MVWYAGKIESWAACKDDATRRDTFWPRKQAFLKALPEAEQERLRKLSEEPRDDSKGEAPGSERGDEEERLFVASLSEEDRQFVEAHSGLSLFRSTRWPGTASSLTSISIAIL